MLAFAFMLTAMGWLLLYSAVVGSSPLAEIKAVFNVGNAAN